MPSRNNLPPVLSFNINFSDTSSQEDISNNMDKLQYAEKQKLEMQRRKIEEQLHKKIARQQEKEANTGEFKVPKSQYCLQQLFKTQSVSDKYVRKSVLPKVVAKNKKMPFSSTPKICVPNNKSSEIDISPISKKARHTKFDRTRTRSFDELPPSKRLKTLPSGLEILVNVCSNENATGDQQTNNIWKNEIVSKNKQNVTTRKNKNVLDTIDILGRNESGNSRNLTFEAVDRLQNNIKYKHLLSTSTSPNISCNLPYHSKDKNVTEAKASFDNVFGLSASIISISSEDASSNDSPISGKFVEKKKEVSKRSACINTTKVKEPSKIIQKCTVSTQKNAIKDTSTNTTPFRDESDTVMEEAIEKERSRKSIGTNTSNKKVERKTRTYKKSKTSTSVSVLNNSNNRRTGIRYSLRPQSKTIDYSYSYAATNNSSTTSRNEGTLKQSNCTSSKQTKKRKTKRLMPASLSKPTKSKQKKDNEHLPKERLSGFYETHMEGSMVNNSANARNRRPASLFIQSHLVGSGSLRKVLLKRLTTNKVQLESTENKNKIGRGSSVARKSTKPKDTRKRPESISNDDDTTFKKPFPVKKSQSSASTTVSIGPDKELRIGSPIIETIDEISYDESSEVNEVSSAPSQNLRKQRDISDENSSVENKMRLCKGTAANKMPVQSFSKTSRQKRSPENGMTVSKDSGLATFSSNPLCSSNPLQMSTNLQQTEEIDVPHSYSTKLDVDPPSSLNDAVYEVNDSPRRSDSQRKRTVGVANSIQSTSKDSTIDYPKEGVANNSPARSTRNSNKETTFNKPRKSVTFIEPIVAREKPVTEKKLGRNVLGNSGLCEASKNVIQPACSSANSDFDNSDPEIGNRGALCTLINNKPVLLRNWNSDMPDLSSGVTKDLVRYTMKNIPFVGATFSSGCIVIPPGERKAKHAAMKHYLFFHVLCGEALIKVQGEKIIGKAGTHFIVPLGSVYSITNVNSENRLVLSFEKYAPH